MWAIVPLKYFANAKSRLAPVLSVAERQLLVRHMARDVLRALTTTAGLDGILLVSREAEVVALAEEFEVELFVEPEGLDLSSSVELASQHLIDTKSASGTLIVHADIPLANPAAFNALLAAHDEFTLVPDDQRQGTNCIAASPPNPIKYRYDGKSFEPHRQAADQAGLRSVVCEIPALALDIDTPEDLQTLISANSVGETAAYLASSGIALRLSKTYSD